MSMSDHGRISGNLGGNLGDLGNVMEGLLREEMEVSVQRVVAGQIADLWPGERVSVTKNDPSEVATKGLYTITRTYVEGHDAPASG